MITPDQKRKYWTDTAYKALVYNNLILDAMLMLVAVAGLFLLGVYVKPAGTVQRVFWAVAQIGWVCISITIPCIFKKNDGILQFALMRDTLPAGADLIDILDDIVMVLFLVSIISTAALFAIRVG